MWRSMAVIRTFTDQAIGYGATEVPAVRSRINPADTTRNKRRVTRAACVCAGPGHVRVRRTWTYVTLSMKGASNGHKIHGEG
jgi:hypothetical protein